MNNAVWAVEQVKKWRETNTNSLDPKFKECLDATIALAENALAIKVALENIKEITKAAQ